MPRPENDGNAAENIDGCAGDVIDIDRASEDEAIEAWREFLRALDPYLKISGEMCVKNIARTVMLKIARYVNEENMFTMYDERLFTRYAEIMACYAETVGICNEGLSDVGDLRIAEILSGISEILSAQLKQYEEHIRDESKNPIRSEKESILKSVYECVLRGLHAVSENIFSYSGYFEKNELRDFCLECAGKSANESHIDLLTFLYQRAIEKGGLDIYKSYSGAIMECKSRVNSFELRKETHYFYEALKQETENLDSIVKVQISALRGELEKEITERPVVDRIIESLMKTYNLAEEGAAELNRVFGEAEGSVKIPVLMNYDNFLSFVEEKGMCAYTDRLRAEGLETGTLSAVQLWMEKLEVFISKFRAFTDEYARPSADPMPYKRFLYEMRLRITDKLILTDEMLRDVRGLAYFYTENAERMKESVPEFYMKIIDGINESILIKIDVIEEGRKDFEDEANKMIAGCVPPRLSEDDLKTLFRIWLGIWRDEMPDISIDDYSGSARNGIPGIIRKINEISRTEELAAKTRKEIGKETDRFIKLEASYLKDCLLFEIITFEEILTYSVSKLKECGNETAGEYAARCGELEEAFVRLCKLHNIVLIAPEPYDAFNSTEHEVLVAEKSDGYKKGQIIKKMNSGFKYNEQVLLRANVIAAR